MLDIKLVREKTDVVKQGVKARHMSVDVDEVLRLDQVSRAAQRAYDEARAAQRDAGKDGGKEMKQKVQDAEDALRTARAELDALMLKLPNFMADDTPQGADDNSNVEIARFGEEPKFSFTPKDHVEIGKRLGLDFEAGAAVAGAGFTIMRGKMAQYERAVMQFVVDEAAKIGFEYMNVPVLARTSVLRGIGFNPRRDDAATEIFNLADDDLCLTGTAEITLVGHLAGQSINTTDLPIKLIAQTPCFRREGGASGRRDKGLYRQKTFTKAELVAFATPEQADGILEQIRGFEENIFKQLGLCFRIVRICAGDLGAPAYKKYDVEALMYGRSEEGKWGWGELTSCSNCTDFQSRRLEIFYKNPTDKGRGDLVYTLNGTGVTTRVMIPLLEQFQQADGTVRIPEVLRPYMKGASVL